MELLLIENHHTEHVGPILRSDSSTDRLTGGGQDLIKEQSNGINDIVHFMRSRQ